MKFRYNGDVENYHFRGYKFPINTVVDVKEDDIIKKLENNSHYTKVKTRKAKSNGDSSGNKE